MNSYEIITNSILEWAKQHENIRAVILIGSRARTSEKADKWSDLDLVVIAEDISEYIQTTSWIHEFGTPLLIFTETAFDESYERRVLYEGFLDVDFAFSDPAGCKTSLEFEGVRDIYRRGYRVLLDKDDWSSCIDRACKVSQRHDISPQMILNEIHDYWYHCVWTAMNCLNCYMKTKLLRMLEHMTTLSGEQTIDTWHNGRFLEKWADPSIVHRLQGSFSDYNRQALTLALQHQMEVYHDMASHVAARQGISYPTDEIQTIKDWILKIGDRGSKNSIS